MKKVSLLFIVLISLTFSGFAQRFDFSIRNALPQFSNPAYVGTAESGRINYGLMLQNLSLSSNSMINFFSYDQHISPLHGGLGMALYDQQFANGQIKKSAAELNYAYQINLGEQLTLSAGAGIAYRNERINFNAIYPYFPDSIGTFHHADYSLGIVAYTTHLYAGFRYGQYQQNFYYPTIDRYTSRNYSAHVGYEFSPFQNKNLAFNASAFYFFQEGFNSLALQVFFKTNRFSFGTQWRRSDQLIFLGGVYFWRIEAKLAHSIQLSPLSSVSGSYSSTALTLQYNFQNKLQRNSNAFKMSLF